MGVRTAFKQDLPRRINWTLIAQWRGTGTKREAGCRGWAWRLNYPFREEGRREELLREALLKSVLKAVQKTLQNPPQTSRQIET